MAESQTQISTARARANELVRAAETQRSQILADLDDRSSRVEQERQSLHDHRRHLDHAYEQVAKALSDARAALATGAEPPPAADAARPERPPAGQRRPENPAPADRPAANRGPTERAAGGVRRGDGGAGGDTRREGVFDWSGGAVPSDDPRPKPAGRPAPGRAPYADADAVAG